ncbi:MAG: hypothetical protein EAZ77_12585 [Nostocales cyanobacterium]|nr:MAG: hypothetical protein EAZ77_12585 [Nostocales cyanobacterium]
MQIQTTAQIIINGKIEDVFDSSIESQNLPKFFTGYKSIPAIIHAKTTDGLPLHQGSMRIVKNSDSSEIEEIIINLQRPTIQEYELMRGFQPPFSWLVSSASGKWLYSNVNSGTQIIWQFEFKMKNYLTYLFFNVAIKKMFQQAQMICLENLKAFVEQ